MNINKYAKKNEKYEIDKTISAPILKVVKFLHEIPKETKFPEDVEKNRKNIVTYYDCRNAKEYYGISEIEAIYKKNYTIALMRERGCGYGWYNTRKVWIKYIDEIKALRVSFLKFSQDYLKAGDTRDWTVETTVYITGDKTIWAKEVRGWRKEEKSKEYIEMSMDDFNSLTYETFNVQDVTMPVNTEGYACSNYTQNEFHKLFPIINTGGNNFRFLKTISEISEYLRYSSPVKKSGPKQNYIDSLVAINLPKIKLKDLPLPKTKKENLSFTKIEKVKEGVAVIRWLFVNNDQTVLKEGARLYVDGSKASFCRINDKNEFITSRLTMKASHFASANFLPFDKSALEKTTLKYYGDIIDEVDKKYKSLLLWGFLTYPNLEKLYKAGYKSLVQNVLSQKREVKNVFKNSFGIDISAKTKNINTLLGLNKYQLEKLNKYFENGNENNIIIKLVKEALSEDGNISAIDNDTFDAVFKAIESEVTTDNYSSWWLSYYGMQAIISKVRTMYSLKAAVYVAQKYELISKKTVQIDSYYGMHYRDQAGRLYIDYLNMVDKMEDTKNFKYQFEKTDDIKEMHDAATAIYNLKKETYKLKAFQSQAKKWKKFVYNNEEYTVVAPEHPGELANEGMALHHCVKSYIERVADGKTNILFIRKNTELTKPFFTVEISNSGVIEQVHGFGNCNTDAVPGLTEFVKEWAKEKKLKLNRIDKVR